MTTASSSAPEDTFTAYAAWLTRQPLSLNTKRAYRGRVHQFCAYLTQAAREYGDPLSEPHARDYAVRDYKTYLKTVGHARPASVNLTLAALDHFYGFLHLDKARVKREDLPQQAPQGLETEEQIKLLRAIERRASIRDQAVARLLFYTALRLHESAALNVDDVLLSARKGVVIVRSGKGDTYREVPLNAETRDALRLWLRDRHEHFTDIAEPALFLSRKGHRLAMRSIDYLLRQIAADAGLTLSAHTLRHTCLTNLVRAGHDIVLVAEIAGHKRLETTRRYSLPSQRDREAAMESLQVEY